MTVTEMEFNSRRRRRSTTAVDADAAELMDVDNNYNESEDDESREQVEKDHQRRELRKRYRQLLLDTEDRKQELVLGTSTALVDRINEANNLYNQITLTTEATLDSRLLAVTSELGAQHIKNTRLENSSVDMSEYIGRIRHFMGANHHVVAEDANNNDDEADELDWKSLASVASYSMRTAPSFRFLLGPLSIEVKQRKVGTQRVRAHNIVVERDEEEREPEELQVDDIQKEENETTRNIKAVHSILSMVGPLPFWKFVINPDSFSQSVENVFYCAFLTKEGRVVVSEAEDKSLRYPDVTITACEALADEERALMPKYQYMVTLDIPSWKMLIQKYNITESSIPTRPPTDTGIGLPDGSKWY